MKPRGGGRLLAPGLAPPAPVRRRDVRPRGARVSRQERGEKTLQRLRRRRRGRHRRVVHVHEHESERDALKRRALRRRAPPGPPAPELKLEIFSPPGIVLRGNRSGGAIRPGRGTVESHAAPRPGWVRERLHDAPRRVEHAPGVRVQRRIDPARGGGARGPSSGAAGKTFAPGITRGIVTRGIVRRSFRLLRRFGGDGVHEWHERPQIFPARRRG